MDSAPIRMAWDLLGLAGAKSPKCEARTKQGRGKSPKADQLFWVNAFSIVVFEQPGFPWQIPPFLLEGRHQTLEKVGIGWRGHMG